MKISGIATTALALPFREPYHWAGRVDHGAGVVLVELQTDEGVAGVGESTAGFAAPGLGVELDDDAVARAADLYRRDERYHHA